MASPVHPSNDNNAAAAIFPPAAAASAPPAKSLSQMTSDELLEKALALPEGPAQERLLELYNARSVAASEASSVNY